MAGLSNGVNKGSKMSGKNSNLGKEGEDKAVNFLTSKGYNILERNYKSIFGEIDIIAKEGKTIVFIEVKSRKNYSFGTPIEQISWNKQQHIIKIALTYLKKNQLQNQPVRFDVIGIFPNKIELIKNAFESGNNYFY